MSISLGGVAGTGRINHHSPASLDDLATLTFIAWVRASSATPATTLRLFDKAQLFVRISTAGSLIFQRTRATINTNATALLANCANFGANALVCIAGVMVTGGVNGDQKLYVGTETAGFAEPSAYATQLVGSGALTTDAADNLYVGNSAAFNIAWDDRMESMAIFGSALTISQLDDWRTKPRPKIDTLTALMFNEFTSNPSVDWSGNDNTGDFTNTTFQAHLGTVQLWGPTQRRRH